MGDISKKTLAILLLVAIVLSAVATWKILNNEPVVVKVGSERTQGGSHVSFNVGGEQQVAKPVTETGKVAVGIQ